MEMDNKKPFCPVLDVDGVISGGKQFDLDITLPEDNRDVIYGVVKICAKCHHEGKCLKGDKCDKCDCFISDCDEHDKCDKCEKEDCFEKPECK